MPKRLKRLGKKRLIQRSRCFGDKTAYLWASRDCSVQLDSWLYTISVIVVPSGKQGRKQATKWFLNKSRNLDNKSTGGSLSYLRWMKDTLLSLEEELDGNIIGIYGSDDKRERAYSYLTRYEYEYMDLHELGPGFYKALIKWGNEDDWEDFLP